MPASTTPPAFYVYDIQPAITYQSSICKIDDYSRTTSSLTLVDDIPSRSDIDSELSLFLSYPENWDGYGAQLISNEVVTHVQGFLNKLPHQLLNSIEIGHVMPTPNGTITIDWVSNEEKVSVEIGEVLANYYIRFKKGEPKFSDEINFFHEIPFELIESISSFS